MRTRIGVRVLCTGQLASLCWRKVALPQQRACAAAPKQRCVEAVDHTVWLAKQPGPEHDLAYHRGLDLLESLPASDAKPFLDFYHKCVSIERAC